MLEVLSKNSKMKIENKYYIYSVLLPCKLEYMLDTMMKVTRLVWSTLDF